MNITKQNIYDSLNGKREFTPMHYSKVEEIIKNTNDLDDSIIRLHGLDRKVVNELWYLTENVYDADIEAHTKNDIIISGDIREVGHELNHNTFMAESPDTDETLLQFLKTIENNEHGGYKTIKEDCNIETRRDFGLIQKIHSKLVYLSNKYYKH
jgi:hypothetical protein